MKTCTKLRWGTKFLPTTPPPKKNLTFIKTYWTFLETKEWMRVQLSCRKSVSVKKWSLSVMLIIISKACRHLFIGGTTCICCSFHSNEQEALLLEHPMCLFSFNISKFEFNSNFSTRNRPLFIWNNGIASIKGELRKLLLLSLDVNILAFCYK